jgi:hypothetical protein
VREYCGCQALAAIDELTREHDLVVGLIAEARSARAASDIPRLARLARPAALAGLTTSDREAIEEVRAGAGSGTRPRIGSPA